jgi:ABC-2 type transport system permease protein
MGLLISTVTSTQQVAMMISQMATLLPTIMLSGLIFPIAAMPKFLQYFSYIVPARFYLLIVRGILLKGSTLTHLLTPVIILSIYSLVLLNIAARKFSLNLEK